MFSKFHVQLVLGPEIIGMVRHFVAHVGHNDMQVARRRVTYLNICTYCGTFGAKSLTAHDRKMVCSSAAVLSA